ncbi:chloride channel protein [Phyllobacterium sp. 21LDTY02-6]|uniref:chloride channel protein n=1 Tax=Phyllobacterium sp. 21LDTY02-6 TaxID=2944903 RepID=UPI002021076A|nr:chloride channel protein [Phyllobacterium sp. 21LDTY02-6]MCO4315893.1 chloride channel protein [Phyllobacterium sp. 21LDTY02-6]
MPRKLLLRQLGVFSIFLAPSRLRAFARSNEFGLLLAASVIGLVSGLVVSAMSFIAQMLHQYVFGLDAGERLSASTSVDRTVLFVAPIVGGAILGLLLLVLARYRKKPIVDPIEANALHGGRLSLNDSLIVAGQNLISNGFGASVGLEAGYTQLASGMASKIGLSLQLRRSDMRILVGCGAAGGIAAAFNAPLTGAFYAFELIIGTYSILSLAPVTASALIANLVARALAGDSFLIDVGSFGSVVPADYVPALLLGLLCAAAGIALMQCVTFVEGLARRSFVPHWLRPMLGGVLVGGLGLISPQVMSGGHGALHLNLDSAVPVVSIVAILFLKALASAISIGSGFRGGLFFGSLFMGALLGKLFAYSAPYIFAHATLTPVTYAVVGMSALAVSVIGGPLTMTFLALEITGDFPITVLVLAAVIAASITVRNTFGYSFATWRFHLRGESIRSAHDVGWIRNLTVGKLMRTDVRTASEGSSLAQFRKDFPLGSTQRVIIVGEDNKYVGMVIVAEAHAGLTETADENMSIDALLKYKSDFLQPEMNARQAARIFDKSESEALAVVNDLISRRVVGLLTESHTLKRYSEELDRQRRLVSGEI